MAIPGDFIWDVSKYKISSTTKPATDWKERVAVRWAEMLGYTPETLKPLISLSDADCQKLLTPGYYPKMVSGAVTVMSDGTFPNIINHKGEFRSPDGVLGLPEQNEFGNGSSGSLVGVPDPAV